MLKIKRLLINFVKKTFIAALFCTLILKTNITSAQNSELITEKNLNEIESKEDNANLSIKELPKEKDNNLKKSTLLGNENNDISDVLLDKEKDILPKSLMFNDQEKLQIKRTIEALKNNKIYEPSDAELESQKDLEKELLEEEAKKEEEEELGSEKSYLYLASLLYYSEYDWVVWINDQKITYADNDSTQELYIKNINHSQLDIIWSLSVSKWKIISGNTSGIIPETNENNQIVIEFTIRPNQTFVLKDRSIIEGKIKVSQNKSESSQEQQGLESKSPEEGLGEFSDF